MDSHAITAGPILFCSGRLLRRAFLSKPQYSKQRNSKQRTFRQNIPAFFSYPSRCMAIFPERVEIPIATRLAAVFSFPQAIEF
jgi:hypothetical protein